MKSKKTLTFCGLLAAIVVTSIFFNSCKDKDEPVPEIITETARYYILGDVVASGNALAGVTVKVESESVETDANGKFKLAVTKKGDHLVIFSKSGYVTVSSEITFNEAAEANSSVALRQSLTKTNPSVRISPDQATVVTDDNNEGLSLMFPIGAVGTATNINFTEYSEGDKVLTNGATSISLASFNAIPDGLVFEKPVIINLKNPVGSNVSFSNVAHYVERNYKWVKLDNVTYDQQTSSYQASLTGFSNHSLRIDATVFSTARNLEVLDTKVVDNLGVMSAKTEQVTLSQKLGWEINGDLESLLKARFPALNDATITILSQTIEHSIASLKGTEAGVSEIDNEIVLRVSGDVEMTVVFTSVVNTVNITFPLQIGNNTESFSVPVKSYEGVQSKITYRYGTSYPEHSGGSGN